MCPLYKLFGLMLASLGLRTCAVDRRTDSPYFPYTTSSSRPSPILYMSPDTVNDILCPSVVEPVLDNFVSDIRHILLHLLWAQYSPFVTYPGRDLDRYRATPVVPIRLSRL